MSDTNGWPDAARPGVPANPERDGWHWLRWHTYGSGLELALFWDAPSQSWNNGYDEAAPAEYGAPKYRYLGPCHTPAEVAALVAEARREGMEEAAKWHDERAVYCSKRAVERMAEGHRSAFGALKTVQAAHENSAAALRARAQEAMREACAAQGSVFGTAGERAMDHARILAPRLPSATAALARARAEAMREGMEEAAGIAEAQRTSALGSGVRDEIAAAIRAAAQEIKA